MGNENPEPAPVEEQTALEEQPAGQPLPYKNRTKAPVMTQTLRRNLPHNPLFFLD